MMNVRFVQPFDFNMEIINFDENIPSVQVKLDIEIAQFQHTLTYSGVFWIACDKWNNFVNALSMTTDFAAQLSDMNNYFSFVLCKKSEDISALWSFSKTDVEQRIATASLSSKLNDDALCAIRNAFICFPAWWH